MLLTHWPQSVEEVELCKQCMASEQHVSVRRIHPRYNLVKCMWRDTWSILFQFVHEMVCITNVSIQKKNVIIQLLMTYSNILYCYI